MERFPLPLGTLDGYVILLWHSLSLPYNYFDRSKAVILVYFLLNVFGVGVSCRILYSSVGYLYVSDSGSITSVREERANLSAIVHL